MSVRTAAGTAVATAAIVMTAVRLPGVLVSLAASVFGLITMIALVATLSTHEPRRRAAYKVLKLLLDSFTRRH